MPILSFFKGFEKLLFFDNCNLYDATPEAAFQARVVGVEVYAEFAGDDSCGTEGVLNV